MLVRAATLITPHEVLVPGSVRTDGATVAAVGAELDPLPGEEVVDFPGCTLTPGLVDMHCHGGGGSSFSAVSAAQILAAVHFHQSRGTTTVMASLVSAPADELARSIALLAELTEEGVVAGIHLEGPFLSHARCGAQNPAALLVPDRSTLARLLDIGRGAVRMVTVAPELPGAVQLVRQIADTGALPAVGHTDATYEQTMDAFRAGARVMTHLFNGMRPVHHREPGPVLAALENPDVCCELIADDNHLHPAIVQHVMAVAGASRVALISDAIAAAGMADGDYDLGGLAVEVRSGVARLAGGGSLAGSTITVGQGVRSVLAAASRDPLPRRLVAAFSSASATPAGLVAPTAGVLGPGRRADLVVWDDVPAPQAMLPVRVMLAGRWLGPESTGPVRRFTRSERSLAE